jgi:hypothetical protein
MMKNTIEQMKRSRLRVKLALSVAILAAATFLSPTTTQAFTLIEQPASHLWVFAPVAPNFGEMVRLNAANVFCDGSVRVLFTFFDGDGRTLMQEEKSVACGQVASSALPYIERTDVSGPHVYGLIAVLLPQRPGNAQRGCPSDNPGRGGPLATSLELIGLDGSVRQTLLPAVQRSCR